MGAILKVRCQIQSMHIYVKNILGKFHPNPIWNDGALGFFSEEVAPARSRRTCRVALWDQIYHWWSKTLWPNIKNFGGPAPWLPQHQSIRMIIIRMIIINNRHSLHTAGQSKLSVCPCDIQCWACYRDVQLLCRGMDSRLNTHINTLCHYRQTFSAKIITTTTTFNLPKIQNENLKKSKEFEGGLLKFTTERQRE